MSGPWEDYQNKEEGPWSEYQSKGKDNTSYQPTTLERAAEVSQGVQDAILGPVARASDIAARGFSNLAFGSEKPAEYAKKAIGTVTGGIDSAAEWAAGKMGEAGVNPYVSGAIATVGANLPYMIPLGEGTKYSTALEPAVGKPGYAARIKQMRTGVDASSFERLRRDPTAFFLRDDRNELGAAVGKAKENAGVNLGVKHNELSTFTPENLKLARQQNAVGKASSMTVAEKIQNAIAENKGGDNASIIKASGVTADEVSKAIDLSNNRLAKLHPGTPEFKSESAVKSNLQGMLEVVSPELKQANKDFSRVALRDEFMEPFPVNQAGTMSKISAFGGAPLAGGVGALVAGGPGALVAGVGYQAARSPFIAGAGTAIRGLVDKALDPALTSTIRSASRRGLITAYIENRSQGSK